MDAESRFRGVDPRLVTKIIASYVAHHEVAPEQIPGLISSVHQTFGRLNQPPEPHGALTPAVPVRRSVQRDHVVCLDCGWKGKMLRRHLTTRHGLRAEEYLRRWGLASDHLLTAPTYSKQRSTLAKELGLGRGGRPSENAPAPNQAPTALAAGRRRRPRAPAPAAMAQGDSPE
ncbi:MAG: MucR family transcriptional regulator [Alphaproteobacteria bacterium]|nr:MucR family transcriptional regulator [Alphaproteobacteria bacterium]